MLKRLIITTRCIRIVFLMIMLFTTLAETDAQSNYQLDFSIYWSPQTNWIINEDDYNAGKELDYKLTYSLNNVGTSLGLRFQNGSGIELGIKYSNQGQKYNAIDPKNNIELTYVKFPVQIYYRSPYSENKIVGWYAKIGPQFSLLQNAKLIPEENSVPTVKEAFTDYNFEIQLLVGPNFNITRHISLFSGLSIEYSLNDIENKDFQNSNFYPIDRLASNAATIGIALGIAYTFRG